MFVAIITEMCCTVYYIKCPTEHLPHFRQVVFSGLFSVTNLTWFTNWTLMQTAPIPMEYPYQYWDSLLVPNIHVHFLGNLSSDIMVRKLPCVQLFTRRTSHVVSDYKYIFHKSGICRRVLQWYGNCWIEHGELNAWPPHFPDRTLLDFYLWGYMKDLVYENKSQTKMKCYEHPEFCSSHTEHSSTRTGSNIQLQNEFGYALAV
jgi:hypothetical protein